MRRRLRDLGAMHPLWVVATIVGVGGFAVAQPILDLVGRNPEFFVARRFPSLDIVVLAVGLALVPAALAVPVLALRLVGPTVSAVAHVVVVGGLVTLLAAGAMNVVGLGGIHPWLFGLVASALGVAVAWLLVRFSPVRVGLRYLAAAPVIFVVVFLLATPVSGLLLASAGNLPDAGSPDAPGPVVVMVFDEMPTASITGADGEVDPERHPSLARLAADGVWYRNAVGVRQQTEEALPSILTGVGVEEGSIPIAADHPYNLFTMLDDGFDVAAVENVTELCPRYVCENVSRPVEPVGERWSAIRRDLSVVYRHLVYPEALTVGLPPIDESWTSFDRAGGGEFDIIERFIDQVTDDRRRDVERFLGIIDDGGDEPPLRFAHFLYPHHPWDLTADGRVHGAPRPPGRFEVGWGDDPFLVAQGWQRHLIQVGYVDTIVGNVMDRLEAVGLYESAMIVVAADHGISISPGVEHQRIVTPETTGSVAFVPLLVKYPAGMERAPEAGTLDTGRAETIDIVPTIAETVGVTVPWSTDGVSLLDEEARARRSSSTMLGSRGEVEIDGSERALFEVVEEKTDWFPGGDPYALTPPGWEDLPGAAAAGEDSGDVEVTIDQRDLLASYRPGDDPVPAYLSGEVELDEGASGDEIVAISIAGKVVAVTRTFDAADTTARWEAMVDPAHLGEGSVEAWLVSGTAGHPDFRR